MTNKEGMGNHFPKFTYFNQKTNRLKMCLRSFQEKEPGGYFSFPTSLLVNWRMHHNNTERGTCRKK
jgi:hypothetical protein